VTANHSNSQGFDTREAREARRIARREEAREVVTDLQQTRRKRDNRWAIGLLLGAVILTGGMHTLYTQIGAGAPEPTPTAAPGDTTEPVAEPTPTETAPPSTVAEGRTWTGTMNINGIPLEVEYDGAAAPQAVSVAVTLANKGFYNNTPCHRLTTEGIYVLQCGDPEGTGTGGPGYNWGPIENAPEGDMYPEGTIAMARRGGDGASMGSQFFIVTQDSMIPSDQAGGYTVMGKVTSGLDELKEKVVSQGVEGGLTDGPPAAPVTINEFSLQ